GARDVCAGADVRRSPAAAAGNRYFRGNRREAARPQQADHERRNRPVTGALAQSTEPFQHSKMSTDTPCIAVCMIDPRTSLCFGCGRTLPEIARWHRMESAERLAVMAQLPARMSEAGLPQPAMAASPKAR